MTKPTHEGPKSDMTAHLSTQQHKYKDLYIGLMAPSRAALDHPVALLLLDLATMGCHSHIPKPWTPNLWETAIAKGAHPSAMDAVTAAQLHMETLEKIAQGYAWLIDWDSIKDNPSQNLKISLIIAIPHKSRGFQMILDLSHGVTISTKCYPSINELTMPDAAAPTHSMVEWGNVLPCLIYVVATAPNAGPILFSKLDIKDRYWHIVVPSENQWHFAYMLLKLQQMDPTQLVIPLCPQMGWCNSPAYFCTASKTTQDVSVTLATQPMGSLSSHPLENHLVST